MINSRQTHPLIPLFQNDLSTLRQTCWWSYCTQLWTCAPLALSDHSFEQILFKQLLSYSEISFNMCNLPVYIILYHFVFHMFGHWDMLQRHEVVKCLNVHLRNHVAMSIRLIVPQVVSRLCSFKCSGCIAPTAYGPTVSSGIPALLGKLAVWP